MNNEYNAEKPVIYDRARRGYSCETNSFAVNFKNRDRYPPIPEWWSVKTAGMKAPANIS